jgi:hypothetical protein
MANKVTNEDILRINEIYYKTHTYAETARQTGFAASTVKKYIIKDWAPISQKNIQLFNEDLIPDIKQMLSIFEGLSNYGFLCTLTENEQKEIAELWEELSL